MVDVLDKGSWSVRTRGPQNSVRRVKRAKPSQQDARSEVAHVPAADQAPIKALDPADTASIVAADIQRALTETVSEWASGVPLLFWVAVSRAHMVAQVYRHVRLVADGHVKLSPRDIVKGLARWVRPFLPEVSLDIVDKFLMATRLDVVVEVYVDLLLRVSRLGLHFSKYFGTEQRFDVELHSEVNEGLLRVRERCLVVFPDIRVRVGASEPSKVLSPRYVLPTQSLEEELEAIQQEQRQGASGAVGMAPFTSATRKNESTKRDAHADADALKDFAWPDIKDDEWVSLLRDDASHDGEPPPALTQLATPLGGSQQRAGGDLGGVESSEKKPSGRDELLPEELGTRQRAG